MKCFIILGRWSCLAFRTVELVELVELDSFDAANRACQLMGDEKGTFHSANWAFTNGLHTAASSLASTRRANFRAGVLHAVWRCDDSIAYPRRTILKAAVSVGGQTVPGDAAKPSRTICGRLRAVVVLFGEPLFNEPGHVLLWPRPLSPVRTRHSTPKNVTAFGAEKASSTRPGCIMN